MSEVKASSSDSDHTPEKGGTLPVGNTSKTQKGNSSELNISADTQDIVTKSEFNKLSDLVQNLTGRLTDFMSTHAAKDKTRSLSAPPTPGRRTTRSMSRNANTDNDEQGSAEEIYSDNFTGSKNKSKSGTQKKAQPAQKDVILNQKPKLYQSQK